VRARPRLPSLLLAAGLVAGDLVLVQALETAGVSFDTLEGAGWSLHEATLRIDRLDTRHAQLRMQAARAVLPEPLGTLHAVSLGCPQAEIRAGRIRCDQARLRADSGRYGHQELAVGIDYTPASGRLAFRLDGARYAGGGLSARGVLAAGGWDVSLQGQDLQLDALAALLSAAGVAIPALEVKGSVVVSARLQGVAARLERGHLKARLLAESFSDEAGALAGEDLDLQLEAELTGSGGNWQVTAGLQGAQGQLYVDPVYLDLEAQPVAATATLDWHPGEEQLVIRSLDYRQHDTVTLMLKGVLHPGRPLPVDSLEARLEEGRLPALYKTYLQPWLNETVLADLESAGRVKAAIAMRSGELQSLTLDLHDVRLADREERFALSGLTAAVAWGHDELRREQRLAWDSGQLYRVPLGKAVIATESTGSRFSLREPASITVLDGELLIDALELEHGDGGVRRWHVDGILTPVSMRDLTRALGWPEFAGKLSGVIPDVRYADGLLEVGGMLLLRVFDGEVTLDNLRLSQPLGVVPRLWVDAAVRNIDLRLLTEAFSFGRIEGRLGGRVDGLYTESWRPVAFDAQFATPAGDKSRRRISQRAVDNISSIGGGGVGGALSRSLLRVFKDFPYARLGIRCRLENGTCDMGGVEAAPNGYYIVKGRLLPPRLNVIGYADRVDWDSLVAQLVAVTRGQGAESK
jgi:hypothetical protein